MRESFDIRSLGTWSILCSGIVLGGWVVQAAFTADAKPFPMEIPVGKKLSRSFSDPSLRSEAEVLLAALAEGTEAEPSVPPDAEGPSLGNPQLRNPLEEGNPLGLEKPPSVPPAEKPAPETKSSPNMPLQRDAQADKAAQKTKQPNTKQEEPKSSSEPGDSAQAPAPSRSSGPPSLGPEWKSLAEEIHQTVQAAWQIPINTQSYTPAEMMLWALLWGCNAEAAYGGPTGKRVNVLAILCHNYPCADRQLLAVQEGHFAARFGYGYQTRRGEFLALLAWARVPKDYPMQVGQEKRTVADLVEYEKLHCRSSHKTSKTDTSATNPMGGQSHVLLGLSFYLEKPEETSWKNNLDESWSVERLVEEVLTSSEENDDGGLHRLMALSYAVQARRKYHLTWTPLFDRVQDYLEAYRKHAFRCQNEDGTWNPAFFEAVGPSGDRLGLLRSTGLIFRWLAFSSPEDQLYDARMYQSAKAILNLIRSGRYLQPQRTSPLEFASLMYALDGLTLYEQRALASLRNKTPSP